MIVQRWVGSLFPECELGLRDVSNIRKQFENFFKMFAPAL